MTKRDTSGDAQSLVRSVHHVEMHRSNALVPDLVHEGEIIANVETVPLGIDKEVETGKGVEIDLREEGVGKVGGVEGEDVARAEIVVGTNVGVRVRNLIVGVTIAMKGGGGGVQGIRRTERGGEGGVDLTAEMTT